MFCQKCGTKVEEGSAFCPKCGTQIKTADVEEKPLPVQQNGGKKKKNPIIMIAGTVISVLAVILLWKAFKGDFDQAVSEATNGAYGRGNAEAAETDDIAMIQTGYLGAFEDASVKDILDMNFGLSGFSLDWASADMDGQKYVAFYAYFDGEEMDSGTTILFQICSDETFKIAGYAEGGNENFARTEIADFLNNWYMNWYVKNKIGQDASESEIMEGMQALIHNQFDVIPGSAILYGASKDYLGDRKKLCKDIDGTEPLNMSVTELINLYSDNILDIYTARDSIADEAGPDEQLVYPEIQDMDYYAIYGDILLDVWASYGDYTLYDIDGDGIFELITSFGVCDADRVNDFYTVENGTVIMLGEYSGAVSFYGADDGNGIYAVYGHMGYQIVERITKSGNGIQTEEIMKGEVENDEYYSNEYSISLMSVFEVM